MTLHPNPADEFTTLTFFDFENGKYELAIYDVVGREVMNMPFTVFAKSQSLELDTGGFSKGVYFLKVSSEKGGLVKRLVVN